MHRQSFADVHQCITEVSPIYHRPSQRTISNCHQMFGEYLTISAMLWRIFTKPSQVNFSHRSCWYLCSKSQGIGEHRVYNYTFHHRRCKNPQWDRGITDGKLDINYVSNVVRDKRNFLVKLIFFKRP